MIVVVGVEKRRPTPCRVSKSARFSDPRSAASCFDRQAAEEFESVDCPSLDSFAFWTHGAVSVEGDNDHNVIKNLPNDFFFSHQETYK